MSLWTEDHRVQTSRAWKTVNLSFYLALSLPLSLSLTLSLHLFLFLFLFHLNLSLPLFHTSILLISLFSLPLFPSLLSLFHPPVLSLSLSSLHFFLPFPLSLSPSRSLAISPCLCGLPSYFSPPHNSGQNSIIPLYSQAPDVLNYSESGTKARWQHRDEDVQDVSVVGANLHTERCIAYRNQAHTSLRPELSEREREGETRSLQGG